MKKVLQSEYYESLLGYNYKGCFVNEVTNLETKKIFYFKNTKKDIRLTEEKEKNYGNNINCGICEKKIISDKVRDHCHLTGKYCTPASIKHNINVKQKQSNFTPLVFHKSVIVTAIYLL